MDRQAKLEFAIVGAVALVLVSAIGFGVTTLVWAADASSIEQALSNVGTVGGIVSGLSLSGTAVLALDGRFATHVLLRYGPVVRFVLFGGFILLVTASLSCAVAVVWADQLWSRAVLGFSAAVILTVLVSTALMVNAAFSWKDVSDNDVKKNPYSS